MAKKRTSKKQFTIYLNCIQEHPTLLSGKTHPNNAEALKDLWENLTLSLNSCGDGPVRSCVEWKKIFVEWKSATRKKAREDKPLSDLEKTLIYVTGIGAVTGLNIPELGQVTQGIVENEEKGQEEEWEDIQDDNTKNRDENIIIEVVENHAGGTAKKKRSKKTTGDILTDAYQKASNDQKSGLEQIAVAIQSVAAAINRYCDIIEENVE